MGVSMTVPTLIWRAAHGEWWASSVRHRMCSVGVLVVQGCSWVSVSAVNSVPVTGWCGSSGVAVRFVHWKAYLQGRVREEGMPGI